MWIITNKKKSIIKCVIECVDDIIYAYVKEYYLYLVEWRTLLNNFFFYICSNLVCLFEFYNIYNAHEKLYIKDD